MAASLTSKMETDQVAFSLSRKLQKLSHWIEQEFNGLS
jgi:hypothetical protein